MIFNRMPNVFYRTYDDEPTPPPPAANNFEFLTGDDFLLLDGENLDLLE